MKNIIAHVKNVTGTYYAISADGTKRLLAAGDPIYEGDAVYSRNGNSSETDFIQLSYTNGEQVTLTDSSYFLVDSNVAGSDNTSVQRNYPEHTDEKREVLRGHAEDTHDDEPAQLRPNFGAPAEHVDAKVITYDTIPDDLPEEQYDTAPPLSEGYAPGDNPASTPPAPDIYAPIISGLENQVYTENSDPVVLNSHITLTDADGSTIAGTVVEIADFVSGDILSYTPMYGITGSYDPSTGMLTLTGNATAEQYQAVLETISYSSTSDDPTVNDTEPTRDIVWTITDTANNSSTYSTMIAITALTDHPVIDAETTIALNSGETEVTVSGSLTLTDVDDTEITGATVEISSGFALGDRLNFSDQNGITGLYNSATGVLTLSGTATVEEYEAALRSVQYENLSGMGGVNRVVTWTVYDADSDLAGTGVGTSVSVITPNALSIPDNVSASGDKDDANIPITLTAQDTDSEIAAFKLTSLPTNGTLYLDAAMTQAVQVNTEYAATNETLTLYFKPDYTAAPGSGVTNPYGADKYTSGSVSFTYLSIDDENGTEYSATAGTATITVDDVPYAHTAADVTITEKDYDAVADVTVNGNLKTDGGAGNYSAGYDYIPSNGATVHQVQYYDVNGNLQTAAMTGSSVTVSTQYGELTVQNTGAYTYTLSSNIDHSASETVSEVFYYNLIDGDGDISNTASQTIKITDGTDPSVVSISDQAVYEKYLPSGTEPDPAQTTVSGTINVADGSDSTDITFSPSNIAYLNSLGLQSGGAGLTYSISADGHTLTAYKAGTSDTVFSVTITNPDAEAAGYDFTLEKSLDTSDDVPLSLSVTVTDSDGDHDSDGFTVTVYNNTVPTDQTLSVNEDSSASINTVSDMISVSLNDPAHGSVSYSDGKITYTPDADYSGTDTFTYTTVTELGSFSTTVTVTVDPVADAPTWSGTTSYSTDEDTQVSLTGLVLPVITDTDTPHTEKLGYITITDLESGTKILDSHGTVLFTSDGSNTMKIVLVDGGGAVDTAYHYTGLSTTGANVAAMTIAEYQSMQILPAHDTGTDIDMTVSAVSYEVDGSGAPIGTVTGAESSTTVHVEVNAVTDTVDISLTGASTVAIPATEDGWINIGQYFTFTTGDNTDGSEAQTITISGLPADFFYSTTGTGAGTLVGSDNSITVTIPAGGATSASIYIKTPTNSDADYSSLVLTATVASKDSDSDSTVTTDTETDSVNLTADITVTGVADAVTITAAAVNGPEDTKIPFTVSADLTDTDGSESISTVVISNIPAGAKVYDSLGNELTVSGGSVTVTAYDSDASSSYAGTFSILPPQDYNGSITLTVSVTTLETGGDTLTTDKTLTIDVKGVVDTTLGDNDTIDAGRLYVELDNTLTTGAATTFSTDEDTRVDLGIVLKSYENVTNGSADNSEVITVVIQNTATGDGSGFTIVDSAGNQIGTRVYNGWLLTEAQAESAHFLPGEDFGGTLNLAMITTVKDMDGSTVDDVNTQTDLFTVNVTPVADVPDIIVRDVFTSEDHAVSLDIRPQINDIDGSEDVISVKVDNIPPGAVIKLSDGTTVFINDTASDASYTFTVGGSTETGHSASGSTGGTITLADLSDLTFTPPPHFNGSIDLLVTPLVQENTNSSQASNPVTVTVYSQGVADTPYITIHDSADNIIALNGSDMSDGGTYNFLGTDTQPAIRITGDERTASNGLTGIPFGISAESSEHIVSITTSDSPAYSSVADGSDDSETISYIMNNVPDDIRLVDSSGNLVGTYMGAGDTAGTKQWALTETEIQGLLFQAPEKYSGVFEMTLTTIVTENDGDKTSVDTVFTLDIKPEITTTESQVILDSTGSEDGLIVLNFGNSDDQSEEISYIKIAATGSIPDGFTLMVYNGSAWVAASDANHDGYYDISVAQYLSGYAALQVNSGGVWANKDTTYGSPAIPEITGIIIGINDLTDGGSTETDAEVTGNMGIFIDAVADAPTLGNSAGSANGTCFSTFDMNLAAEYADSDGSEFHYFIIKDVPVGWYLTNAENNGDGSWYVTEANLSSVGVYATANLGSYTLTLEGYSIEASNGDITDNPSTHSITVEVTGTCSGSGTWKYAQDPSLALDTVRTTEDTSSLTLADFINEAGTHTNDSDGGSEQLVLIIKDLPAGMELTSATHDLVYYTDENGKDCVRISLNNNGTNTAALTAELQGIGVTVPADFSGDLTFEVDAIALETFDSPRIDASAPVTDTAELYLSPVADGIDVASLMSVITEDTLTALKFSISSLDTYTDASDLAESMSSIRIHIDNGTLTNSAGVSLGNDITVTIDSNNNIFYGAQQVFVKPGSQTTDTVTITVTANSTDNSTVEGSSVNDTHNNWTDSFTVGVSSSPDPAGSTDGSGDVSTLSVADAAGDEDTAIQLNITAVFPDMDGSEIHSLKLTGIPDGALIVDSSGNAIGQNNGDGTWNVPIASLGNIYFIPSPNFSGTVTLGLTAYAIEKDTFASAEHSVTFDVNVTPVADGVVITTHNASGNEGGYIRPAGDTGFLEGALIETENYLQSTYYDPANLQSSMMDELYKVIFTGVDAGMSFYYQDGNGSYVLLQDIDAASNTYTVEGLTQSQLDTLSIVSTDTSGTIVLNAEVFSQENDGSGGYITSAASETGTFQVTIASDIQGLEAIDFARSTTGSASDFTLSYQDGDGSESISGNVTITTDAALNHGTDNGDGTWTLTSAQLAGLTITPGSDSAFNVTVSANITEGSATEAQVITVHYGSGSNDTFSYVDGDYYDGWQGTDTVNMSGQSINLELISAPMTNIENINMTTGSNSITNLSVNDFIDMAGDTDTITITGDSNDTVSLKNGDGGDWADGGVSGGFHIYQYDGHTIKIDVDINTAVS